MKVIIAGSRTFYNYELLKETLQQLNLHISEIVSGEAAVAEYSRTK